jgi:hypothetical protein
MLRPESSQRQEGTKAGEQREEPRTAEAVESEDNDVLEEIQGHPKDGVSTCTSAVSVGTIHLP